MITALPLLLAASLAPTWTPTPSGRPRLRLGTHPLRCVDPDKKRRRKAQRLARRKQRSRR